MWKFLENLGILNCISEQSIRVQIKHLWNNLWEAVEERWDADIVSTAKKDGLSTCLSVLECELCWLATGLWVR